MVRWFKTYRRGLGIVCLLGAGALPGSRLFADDAPPLAPLTAVAPEPATPATQPAASSTELAEPYVSEIGGISLRPPKGLRLLVRLDQKILANWSDGVSTLNIRRIQMSQPTPLVTEKHLDQSVAGVEDMTLAALQNDLPGATLLRKDVTVLANVEPPAGQTSEPDPDPAALTKPNVGILVIRYSAGGIPQLKQQAIIHASDILYYIIEYTTPGSKNPSPTHVDPGEQAAVQLFQNVLASAHLIDTQAIRRDQENSLFATAAFLVNATPQKLRKVLVPEQWFRILVDGKDVGYTYVMEQTAGGLPEPDPDVLKRAQAGELSDEEKRKPFLMPRMTPGDDILIGVKSRMIITDIRGDKTRGPVQLDSESWMFMTSDRKHEDWSRLIVQHDATRPKDLFTEELGTSDQHLIGLKSGATLTVTQTANNVNLPVISQEVPPFYLPQAMTHLLPRLFDVHNGVKKQYAIASFIGERREVVMRYFVVEPAQEVELDGRVTRVIPISDRVGYEGPPTLHYLSADAEPGGIHRYLGSENKQTHTVVLLSDQATIEKIVGSGADGLPQAKPKTVGPPAPGAAAPAGPIVTPRAPLQPVAPKQ